MQNPEHIKSKCPTCKAARGMPCVTRSGHVAKKVHYGRPYWSSLVRVPPPPKPSSSGEREGGEEL